MCVLYLRLPRRPVWRGTGWGLWDVQGALPRSWCVRCGKEVFLWGRELCPACEKEAYYERNEKPL